ncbi:MAG: nuclear transport factor 2 family protein [Pseudomonadota bacterium]
MHMPSHVVDEILALEERLRIAMLAADHDALDQLISADLIFTDHLGRVSNKADDLGMHRSGLLKFDLLQPSEMKISATPQLAVVSVRMTVKGSYDDGAFAADLRYTRIWRRSPSAGWEILAGHSSHVVKT